MKIFRKIRENLLSTGQMKKYAKYAIGEIILVVIGILMALSINNWNENRKDLGKIHDLLGLIKTDLNADIDYFKLLEKDLSINVQTCDKAFNSNYENDTSIAELGKILNRNYEPRINDRTYNTLVNSGLIDLIEDKELLSGIHDYYLLRSTAVSEYIEYSKKFNLYNIEGPLLYILEIESDRTYSLGSMKKEISSGNLISIINWQCDSFKSILKVVQDCSKHAQQIKEQITAIEK